MAEMRNVVLARVDDRLIHGEVVTAWTPTFKANKIIIIDDEVAKDVFPVIFRLNCCKKNGSIKSLQKDMFRNLPVMSMTKDTVLRLISERQQLLRRW